MTSGADDKGYVELKATLEGHTDEIFSIAWSSDGAQLATGSKDKTIRLWTKDGRCVGTLNGHGGTVLGLAWSPDGQLASGSTDTTVKVWNVEERACNVALVGHSARVTSVAWLCDGKTLVSGSDDGTVRTWLQSPAFEPGELHSKHTSGVNCVAASPTDRIVASAGLDCNAVLWNLETGAQTVLMKHRRLVSSVAFSPDGRWLATGSRDTTVTLWNVSTGLPVRFLERHSTPVVAVAFSRNGHLLATKSEGGTVRVTRCIDWVEVAEFLEDSTNLISSIGFGEGGALATFGDDHLSVRLWQIDPNVLTLGVGRHTQYCNAKVVIVGDSGVGKSGLALALSGRDFEPTESTHGRRVIELESTTLELDHRTDEIREILLWDLAGQPAYRLVHQLHLHDADVALIVFDSRSESDPFGGVRYWDRALRQIERISGRTRIRRFLVAARTDRGGAGVSAEQLRRIVEELGIDGVFVTSAKELRGIDALHSAVLQAIEWESLPKVTSTEMLSEAKNLIAEQQNAKIELATASSLWGAFRLRFLAGGGDDDARATFSACIGRLESRGLLRALTFGDCVLLQPELLDSYASSIVEAARDEPDGLGSIPEDLVRAGRFRLSNDDRVGDPAQEQLLLIATVELLLRSEVALREHTADGPMLVFPSQSMRGEPSGMNDVPVAARISFEGPAGSVYTTLAVRLSRSGIFRRNEHWRDGIMLQDAEGAKCGLRLRRIGEIGGEIEIYYPSAISDVSRRQMLEFVSNHVERRSVVGTMSVRHAVICKGCGEALPERQVELRRARGFSTLRCPVCDVDLSIRNSTEVGAAADVRAMDRSADRNRDGESGRTTAEGKKALGAFDVFLSYRSEDRAEVVAVYEALLDRGILPWMDVHDLAPGARWREEVEQRLTKIRTACVFIGAGGLGPWQDLEVEALLERLANRRGTVIPVFLRSISKVPKLPLFLRSAMWVDFRADDPEPIGRIVWGITAAPRRRRQAPTNT